jgi:hypothetical protein
MAFPTTPTNGQTYTNILGTGFIYDSTHGTWNINGIVGSGAVAGPALATDNAAVRFDGTTGKIIQNSGLIIDDSTRVSGAHTFTFDATYSNADASGTETVDWGNGPKQYARMTGNTTFTFTAPAGPANLLLYVLQDTTGSRVATWPNAVLAPGGKASGLVLSTAANSKDIVCFYYDSSNYFGTISKAFAV